MCVGETSLKENIQVKRVCTAGYQQKVAPKSTHSTCKLLVASKFRSVEGFYMVLPRKNHPPLWGYPPSRRGFLCDFGGPSSQATKAALELIRLCILGMKGSEFPTFPTDDHGTLRNCDELRSWSQESDFGSSASEGKIQNVSHFWGGSTTLPYVAWFGELNDLKWSPPVPEHGIEKNQWMKPCKGLPSWCHGAVVADGVG